MTKLTMQDTFDIVAKHLLTQQQKSLMSVDTFDADDEEDTFDNCAYRGRDGLKCAVGVMIPDDLYRPELEGCTVSTVMLRCPEFSNQFERPSDARTLLQNLQTVHDEHEPHEWAALLQFVAKEFSLSTEALEYPNGRE